MKSPVTKRGKKDVKRVKAWAVLEENTFTCWGTPTTGKLEDSVWQYPIFLTRKEARFWHKILNNGTSIIPCTIVYSLPSAPKKTTKRRGRQSPNTL